MSHHHSFHKFQSKWVEFCEIQDSHSGNYENYGLQGSDNMHFERKLPVFQRNLLSQSSGYKSLSWKFGT